MGSGHGAGDAELSGVAEGVFGFAVNAVWGTEFMWIDGMESKGEGGKVDEHL